MIVPGRLREETRQLTGKEKKYALMKQTAPRNVGLLRFDVDQRRRAIIEGAIFKL